MITRQVTELMRDYRTHILGRESAEQRQSNDQIVPWPPKGAKSRPLHNAGIKVIC
jgi:hypothetical protein